MTRSGLILYYDGDCPICSRYRDYVAMRRNCELELCDAREHRAAIEELARDGFDINTGVILVSPLGTFHGFEALVAMRRLTHDRGPGNRLFRLLLKSPGLVRICYPAARLLRHGLLRATGRKTRVEWKD